MVIDDTSRLGDADVHLFAEGSHLRLWEALGAHPALVGGRAGTRFAVWAPSATRVSVIGDWNDWRVDAAPLAPHGDSGIWEGFIPGVASGARYKYHIASRHDGYRIAKADPVGFRTETPRGTASRVWTLEYAWEDAEWLAHRAARQSLTAPMTIYEVHLGSWRRVPEEGDRPLTYRELAETLPGYVAGCGFTHVELLPVMEHSSFEPWGYRTTGYFAPAGRYGAPQDLMFLIDRLHQSGVGVILDWVPVHFADDPHGLGYFDGTHLYEHADPRRGAHPDSNGPVFDHGRNEVRSFLLSSALFWCEAYHADGLRVGALASMLHPGGEESPDAVAFLRRLNDEVRRRHPGVQTVAEEATAWPMVSQPTRRGGLGFGLKWDTGWTHDALGYAQLDPIHRAAHHDALTSRGVYAFSEHFVLPLSHDEVVHGKGSLLGRMPGDEWQRRATLRLLLGFQGLLPGKKLLFMGGELGQLREWNPDASLDWHLLADPGHAGLQRWVRDLNTTYRALAALHELDCDPAGFAWVDCHDSDQSTLAFLRRGSRHDEAVLVACNWTPVPRHNHRLGVPWGGSWREVLNGDARLYGGSGQGNLGGVVATPVAWHGQTQSIVVTLPPLAVVVFQGVRPSDLAAGAPAAR
jgi:1,4-alpha-glucan branching enzyme